IPSWVRSHSFPNCTRESLNGFKLECFEVYLHFNVIVLTSC
ncbi:mCG140434, partial [Mus musculus]